MLLLFSPARFARRDAIFLCFTKEICAFFAIFRRRASRAGMLFSFVFQRKYILYLLFFAGALRAPGCCFPLLSKGSAYFFCDFRRRASRAGTREGLKNIASN